MSTNVKPDELNYDHYAEDKYDRDIVNSIPGHEELHKKIDEVIDRDFKGKKIKILELGIGTGLTALRILRRLYHPIYTAVDFSETMLNNAKRKLSRWDLTYILGDYSKIELPRNNNLVVSVIGIHHQETDKDKQNLFKRIYESLSDNGAFIFGDLVTWRYQETAALNDALHYHYLVENSTDRKTLKEWAYHHKYLNKLAPLEDQSEWLKKIGFREVNVLYTKFNTALVYTKK